MKRSIILACTTVLLSTGCPSESKYDVYLEGAKIEGEAERGPCKLHYAKDAQAAELSGDKVAICLRETERALSFYDKAAAMGYADADFKTAHARAQERKARLESMLTMVRQMEKEQLLAK